MDSLRKSDSTYCCVSYKEATLQINLTREVGVNLLLCFVFYTLLQPTKAQRKTVNSSSSQFTLTFLFFKFEEFWDIM